MGVTSISGGAPQPRADDDATRRAPAGPTRLELPSILAAALRPAPYVVARFVWLRALGLIFFSAFYSLVFQIRGLVGTDGILPADDYLLEVHRLLPGALRFWAVPSLAW